MSSAPEKVEDRTSEQELRDGMIRQLIDVDAVRSSRVVDAFRKVPRHLATPGVDITTAYGAESVIATKWDSDGASISSVSAPRIQAMQIEQADIAPGMRVLEIGSGGVNAAYLAEIVGADGLVVSADIDPEVTEQASRFLKAAGYERRVVVVTGDGENGVPDHAPYDRIIVTVEAADIPPAWTSQLTEGARLVVPLRMRGMTRTVAFVRDGGRLVSDGLELCGFVPMQGAGENRAHHVLLHDTKGEEVALRLDGHPEPDTKALREALRAPRVEAWSGVTIAGDESWDHLDLWLMTAVDNLPVMTATKAARDKGLVASASPIGIPTLVDGASLAYHTVRRTADPAHWELGAAGHGPQAHQVADELAGQIRTWDEKHRGHQARVEVWPAGTPDSALPAGSRVIDRTHTRVTITWP